MLGDLDRRSRAGGVLIALVAVLAGGACTGRHRRRPGAPPGGPGVPPVSGLVWQRLATAPTQRTEVTAAAAGTRVYVVGGYRADGGTLGTVEVFDTATGRWDHGPELPVAVNHAMAAGLAGTVYVFGGYLADGKPSPAAFRLDPGGLRAPAPRPHARPARTTVGHDGPVYLAR